MNGRARWFAGGITVLVLGATAAWWLDRERIHFLPAEDPGFVAGFAPPPSADSAQTRRELDDLLAMQAARTAAQVAAAQSDRRTRVWQFYGALGLDPERPPDLPQVERLAEAVEDDVRIYVRQVKDHFRRLRPYEVEPRLDPCIDDVRGDLSYPSGHAAFGYSMYMLLAWMVPERRAALEQRAAQFARQRMVCGVHYPSDIQAGERAARHLLGVMYGERGFQDALSGATGELRTALGLPALSAVPTAP
jgi:acid phosphatase (class A)